MGVCRRLLTIVSVSSGAHHLTTCEFSYRRLREDALTGAGGGQGVTGRAGERGATGLLLCQGGDAEQLHEQRHQTEGSLEGGGHQ